MRSANLLVKVHPAHMLASRVADMKNRRIPSQVLLIVYKYLSSRLNHPNLTLESANPYLPYVPPRIAHLGLVIFDVRFGLILDRLSFEENLDVLADGTKARE
jgi:hypothetical protein